VGGDDLAQARQPVRVEAVALGRLRRRRQGTGERLRDRRQAWVGGASRPVVADGDVRMAAARFGDDRGRQRGGVVGAEQAEVRRGREGEVEEGLVALALDQLGGTAPGPDRLADAARGRVVLAAGHEVAPDGDDPRRVRADVGHVRKAHAVCPALERGHEGGDPVGAQRHQHPLPAAQALLEERYGPRQERVLIGVEDGLVMKPRHPIHRFTR